MYKYINLYDTKKYHDCGSGCIQHRIDYNDDEDFQQKKLEAKENQSILNDKFRKEANMPASTRGKKISMVGNRTPNQIAQSRLVDTQMGKISPNQDFGINRKVNPFADVITDLPNLKLDADTGNSIVILASSKGGKTTLLKKIYDKYYLSGKSINILFSVNIHAKIYKDLKDVIKVNKFDKESQVTINQMKKINMVSNNKFEYLVMLDDIIDSKYSAVLNNLILTYRNSNFSSIISLQYPYLLSKASRSSINNIFFGSFNTDESIVSVIKSFLASQFVLMGYHTLESQVNLYRELTKDFHFLYYFSRERLLIRFKIQL